MVDSKELFPETFMLQTIHRRKACHSAGKGFQKIQLYADWLLRSKICGGILILECDSNHGDSPDQRSTQDLVLSLKNRPFGSKT
jgi:hypothetical protein